MNIQTEDAMLFFMHQHSGTSRGSFWNRMSENHRTEFNIWICLNNFELKFYKFILNKFTKKTWKFIIFYAESSILLILGFGATYSYLSVKLSVRFLLHTRVVFRMEFNIKSFASSKNSNLSSRHSVNSFHFLVLLQRKRKKEFNRLNFMILFFFSITRASAWTIFCCSSYCFMQFFFSVFAYWFLSYFLYFFAKKKFYSSDKNNIPKSQYGWCKKDQVFVIWLNLPEHSFCKRKLNLWQW